MENAVLLDADAQSGDGTEGMVEVYANQNLSWYEPAAELEGLTGSRGTLLAGQSGRVTGFLPDDTVRYTLIPESRYRQPHQWQLCRQQHHAGGGGRYPDHFWGVLVRPGELSQLTLYYNQSGNLELVAATERTTYEGVVLSGYYEDASPNTSTPDTITLLGMELEVEESAVSSLSAFSVGDKITVALDGDGAVISAAAGGQTTLYGVLGEGQVEADLRPHRQGYGQRLRRRGGPGEGHLQRRGQAVGVPVSGGSSLDLSVSEGTLAPSLWRTTYASTSGGGTAWSLEIDLETFRPPPCRAADIDFYAHKQRRPGERAAAGYVTGNAYTYGLLTVGSKTESQQRHELYQPHRKRGKRRRTTQEYITDSPPATAPWGASPCPPRGRRCPSSPSARRRV